MKRFFILVIIFVSITSLLLSCKKEAVTKEPLYPDTATSKTRVEFGQELFEGKGNCIACHQIDQKVIGPSIQEIAKIYKTQNASLIDFLINDAKPIVDPTQYEVMKTNFAITKAMSDDELKAIETYIYSHSK
ncbi:c-type cytochrome [Flavobacterium sp.]|uniref:c-type cytochrome n=1 Tax=Flavobacterium sp. TaxID=239 RepID=UPI00286C478F|nr:c-type cytochrome [Flavobacterium sp.]